jgi:thiol-disulfide isomerase/thioredoxin
MGKKYGWSSKATFRCSKGHTWTCRAGNALSNKTWCPHCNKVNKRISTDELSETASVFNGKFLGFIEPDMSADSTSDTHRTGLQPIDIDTTKGTNDVRTGKKADRKSGSGRMKKEEVPMTRRLARWECEEGHQFLQRAGNIRRPPGGKRTCSWCPSCRREGRRFVWDPDAVLALAQSQSQ